MTRPRAVAARSLSRGAGFRGAMTTLRHAHDAERPGGSPLLTAELAERFDVDASEFLLCRNGACAVVIAYRDRRDYVGVVYANGEYWTFEDLHAPRMLCADSPLQGGYDCPAALAHMAQSAASFADYYTSGAEAQYWNPHGSHFSDACYGEHDDDGPVFAPDDALLLAHAALCAAAERLDVEGIDDTDTLERIHAAKVAIETAWDAAREGE